jgi:hypothetical protein
MFLTVPCRIVAGVLDRGSVLSSFIGDPDPGWWVQQASWGLMQVPGGSFTSSSAPETFTVARCCWLKCEHREESNH